ncbi:MAG TPA: hypothetical protein VGG39_28255 [Polyangiaceae bacterium]
MPLPASRLLLAAAAVSVVSLLGCDEILYETPETPPAGTQTVCASRSARGACTEWAPHETTTARWFRETADETDRQAAYEKNEPFFPREVPGESAEKRVERLTEERRREDAYRKGEPFLPDHEPHESFEHYVERMGQEQRRQDAYRKKEPFFPDMSRR